MGPPEHTLLKAEDRKWAILYGGGAKCNFTSFFYTSL